jgi:hypothetical protein
MRSKKKKAITLEQYLKQEEKKKAKGAEITGTRSDFYRNKYERAIASASSTGELEKLIDEYAIKVGKYSLRNKIKTNPWLLTGRPASKALEWLHKFVFKDPGTYRYKQTLLAQGQLFWFQYKNPKYKNTPKLPWFDKYPMVLSLGPVVTRLGVRNIGFNLHLVPPKVRIVILCQIFELYKRFYRYNIFYGKQGPVQIKYQYIIKSLEKFGADFAVRMYIPARQNQIVIFPYREWHKAVFLPSLGYDSIKASKLIQLWTKHIRKKKFSTSPNINWTTAV